MPRHPSASVPRATVRWIGALAAAGGIVALVATVAGRAQAPPPPVRPGTAVGDATCLACHADKASYESTAHRRTSSLPSRATIAGSFAAGENVLRTARSGVHYRMHADAEAFYQTAIVALGADTSRRTERIAYVLGSGRKGQSYAYWAGDRLYQLPVSYWTSLDRWLISPGPGYGDGPPNFGRAIAARCLECHATWIASRPDLAAANRFAADGAILGITCERCHGAGREHVARARSPLRALRAPAIVNPARLPRERQVEACAQCHGGLRAPVAPPFTYVAGRRLDDYYAPPPRAATGQVDVHGDQAALLARSRCYRASAMTCATCHDVHRPQRDAAALSRRCLACHQTPHRGARAISDRATAARCVDCHMPQQPSRVVVSTFEGRAQQVPVRTHWIRVHPESAGRPGALRATAAGR